MKISYNPKSSLTAITTETAANDDIIFDLYASKLWAKGVRIGADWADISSKPSSLKNPYAIKFRDINGNEVSYDGSAAKNLTTGTYIARLPYGFSSFDSKPTWGNTTGTSIACWKDASGGSIDFRKDNPASGKMSLKVDGRVYVNEGTNPVLSAELNSSYWGMRTPDGANDWIRTPNNGLLPYINGNAGSGHSSLGTNSWYFSTAYIDKVYGSLKGNADTATTATKATTADTAINAENADKLDGWHKDNILWTGYIASNTANLQSYWAKMYDVTITNKLLDDTTITFLVSSGYDGNFSIFYLRFRQNGANGSGAYNLVVTLLELVGNLKNKIVAYYNNKTGNVLLWGNVGSLYGVLNYTILKKVWRVSTDFATLGTLTAGYFASVQTQPTTDYTKVTMSRVGLVQYAESSSSSTLATKLLTARNLWGNSFDGTKNISGSITFPAIGDTATSNRISWSGSSDGADIYYLTTAKDLGNLVLNVKDDTNAYILLALNGVFKSHFDVANSYWTGRSALADKWTTARTFTIGNTAKNVDGSGNVSWSLAEIGVRDTWRTVQVNGTSIGNNTLNLCDSAYIGLTNVNGKVTFSLVGSSTTANQAILSNGTANGWTLKTLNIANWDTAYNLRHTHANKSVLDGITTGLITNWNTAYTFVSTITGKDTDDVINKWDEIVNFLAGIKDDNKLNTLLGSKLSVYQLADKTNVGAIKNNGIYYSTSDASSGTLTNSPFNNGFTLINMTSLDNGDDLRRSRLAFNAFGEIKVSDDRYEANTAETWYNVLTSKNSGISGSTIKLNGTSITVYSSGTADGRYVKKSGDTMTGVLTIDTTNFEALTIKRNDDANGASIQFRGKSSVYGYIGLNNSTKDKLFLRWNSDTSKVYTILDTSSTYTSSGKGVINGTTITQVDNATNADTVDGYHANSFIIDRGGAYSGLIYDLSCKSIFSGNNLSDAPTTGWVSGIVLGSNWNSSHYQHYLVESGSRWYATRSSSNGKMTNWNTFAYLTDNVASASKLQTPRTIWGQSFDGTADISGTLSRVANILFSANNAYDIGSNSVASRYIYTHWLGAGTGLKLELGANNSGFGKGLCLDTNLNVGIGTNTPSHKLDVKGYIYSSSGFIKENSSNSYVLLGGGSHKAESSLSVSYATTAGSASSATKVIVNLHTTNDTDYPLVWSNLSNTSSATENQLFKSWLDLYYNPKNKRLFVGGTVSTAYINATLTVTSAGFKHSGVTKNADLYVLTAGGGYTFLNLAANELAHEFDVSIEVTSEWTDIPGFHGGSLTFLTLPGTYIVLVYYESNPADGMYQGYFSGIMSWYTGTTNSNNADEIVLHRVGHAYANTIYLRTRESLKSDPDPYTKLQISANSDLKEHTYKFKFKRIC